jgi:uncharacterized protein
MTPTIVHESDKQQVTAVISHLVKPGSERYYEQWLHDISSLAQQFAGHAGVSFIRPQDSTFPEYVIILKFDCYMHLKAWLDSPIRQRWIDKASDLVQQNQKVDILTGLETWFTLPGKPIQRSPKRYKMAVLTTIAVFGVAQLVTAIATPILSGLPNLLRAFVSTGFTVFALTYIVMPRLTRLFYRWLYPKQA